MEEKEGERKVVREKENIRGYVSICVGYQPKWWSEAESEPGPSCLPTGRHLSIG